MAPWPAEQKEEAAKSCPESRATFRLALMTAGLAAGVASARALHQQRQHYRKGKSSVVPVRAEHLRAQS